MTKAAVPRMIARRCHDRLSPVAAISGSAHSRYHTCTTGPRTTTAAKASAAPRTGVRPSGLRHSQATKAIAAAIATGRAAELYGAEVIAHDIGDAGHNVTRFVLLARGQQPPTGQDRTSIAFWFADDRPGSLAGVLAEFASRHINCTKIESRPTRAAFGEYVFLVDFDAHEDDAEGRDVLAAIAPLCSDVKVFGSYPRWQSRPAS